MGQFPSANGTNAQRKWDNSPAQMGQTPSSGTWKNNYPQKETNPEQEGYC
jgi:hypothetical protein